METLPFNEEGVLNIDMSTNLFALIPIGTSIAVLI